MAERPPVFFPAVAWTQRRIGGWNLCERRRRPARRCSTPWIRGPRRIVCWVRVCSRRRAASTRAVPSCMRGAGATRTAPHGYGPAPTPGSGPTTRPAWRGGHPPGSGAPGVRGPAARWGCTGRCPETRLHQWTTPSPRGDPTPDRPRAPPRGPPSDASARRPRPARGRPRGSSRRRRRHRVPPPAGQMVGRGPRTAHRPPVVIFATVSPASAARPHTAAGEA